MTMKTVPLYVSFLLFNYLNCCQASEEEGKHFLDPFLNKKYQMTSVDKKFDKVLEILGFDALKRSLVEVAKPTIELSRLDDGRYTLTTSSRLFNKIVTRFRLGKEFDDESFDGREVKSKFVQDKNVLLQTERGDKTLYILRKFSEDEVRVMLIVDGISSVCIFKLKE